MVTLAPGDQAIADLRATGPRRWLGAPVVRTFGLSGHRSGARSDAAVGSPGPIAGPPPGQSPVPRPGQSPGPPPGQSPAPPPEPLATGTLLQKPRLSRGALSLISLLLAATVFATVITIALTALVGQSAADRNLAIAVAAARNSEAIAGSSALGGTVVAADQRRNRSPGCRSNCSRRSRRPPRCQQTATVEDGSWTIDNLPAGATSSRSAAPGSRRSGTTTRSPRADATGDHRAGRAADHRPAGHARRAARVGLRAGGRHRRRRARC